MSPNVIVFVLAGLVAFATLLGLVIRTTQTRVRQAPVGGGSGSASELPPTSELLAAAVAPAPSLGDRLTLVQFSTEFCARCPATARTLGQASDQHPGVVHLEVDVTRRDDLQRRYSILRTPTVLVLDSAGRQLSRISGPVTAAHARDLIVQHLETPQADHSVGGVSGRASGRGSQSSDASPAPAAFTTPAASRVSRFATELEESRA